MRTGIASADRKIALSSIRHLSGVVPDELEYLTDVDMGSRVSGLRVRDVIRKGQNHRKREEHRMELTDFLGIRNGSSAGGYSTSYNVD